jgi:hypothetical protein
VDAIGGGSINSIKIYLNPLYPKGPVKGEGVRHGTLFSVRGDDKDLTYLMEGLRQNEDAF